MTDKQMQSTSELLQFIAESPTAFHATEAMERRLADAGFIRLDEGENWELKAGTGYYLTRNQSSLLAFRMPQEPVRGMMIAATHTDSPMFKLKPEYESEAFSTYIRLNTEVYGGTILSSWFDRPLTLAGRVILNRDGCFEAKTVAFDRDLVLIPNVAIHFNRTVNTGYAYNPAVDTLPLFSQKGGKSLKAMVAEALACKAVDIASMELYVVNHMAGSVWGADNDFFSAPRIDNLMCTYGALCGFLQANHAQGLNVFYAADNEETGSSTKQGAASVFLSDVLDRICECIGTDKRRLLASSMMISADNAHAKHPNHPELSDAKNAPRMNGGVVIKSNAAQKYTTDGVSAALFAELCKRADVPVQVFSNRSDMAGGSTLGSISNTQVPLLTIDIGMAQLAMHSAYETAGCADTAYLTEAMKSFYNSILRRKADGVYCLEQ